MGKQERHLYNVKKKKREQVYALTTSLAISVGVQIQSWDCTIFPVSISREARCPARIILEAIAQLLLLPCFKRSHHSGMLHFQSAKGVSHGHGEEHKG